MNNLTDIENETSMINMHLRDKITIIQTSKIIFDRIVIALADKNVFSNLVLKWGQNSENALGSNIEIESEYAKDSSQYAGSVFWYGFDFCYVSDNMLKDTMKDVKGIIIKPYCVISQDLEKAVESSSKCHKFKDQPLNFIDIDNTTFNIHKYPSLTEMRFQVVLLDKKIKQNGPGKNPNSKGINIFKQQTLDKKLKCIKTNWYFPAIQESVETCDISGCLADLSSEHLLEKPPIKRLEYLLAVDIVKAMQAVLTENSFQDYLANIDLNALCELELETNAFFLKLDAKRKALTK